jgi:hypothetical protein
MFQEIERGPKGNKESSASIKSFPQVESRSPNLAPLSYNPCDGKE